MRIGVVTIDPSVMIVGCVPPLLLYRITSGYTACLSHRPVLAVRGHWENFNLARDTDQSLARYVPFLGATFY